METQKSRLQQLYDVARAHGLAHSKGEFATLIGVESSSLSHALKDDGKIKIENVITKAEHALMKAGVNIGNLAVNGLTVAVMGTALFRNEDMAGCIERLHRTGLNP